MKRIAILNSSIMPCEGNYSLRKISAGEVKKFLGKFRGISFLNPRHADLVRYAEKEFGIPPTKSAGFWNPKEIPIAIVIRPVNIVRTGEELSGVEYEFYLLTYKED